MVTDASVVIFILTIFPKINFFYKKRGVMDRYIGFVLKRPVMVLLAFLIATILFASGMTKLEFDTTISTLLPRSDPEYKYYERIKEIYGGSDAFVILSVTDNQLWHPDTFAKIDHLIVDIEEFENFNPVLEKSRMERLGELFARPGITGKQAVAFFQNDIGFSRLLARKLETVTGLASPLSSGDKREVISLIQSANDLKSKEMINEILSPFTMKDIVGEDDMLETIELVRSDKAGRRILPKTDAEFQSFIQNLRRNPVFEKGIFATDDVGNITDLGIIVRFHDISDSDPIAREILDIVSFNDDLKIIPQGEPVVLIWINDYMQKDLMRLVPLVMLVAVIIFFINFKSLRGVMLPFVTLSMATLWILGLMGHLGAKITTVGISIPILMIAVGSSYAIHILNQYYADYNLISKEGKTKGLLHAMSHISVTVLLTGLTTFVAFLTLAAHELSAIREWGIFSALGILFAVLISSSIIPAGLKLMPHNKENGRVRRKTGVDSPVIDRIIRWLTVGAIYHYKKVLAVVMVLIVISIAGLFRLKVETELLYYFKENNFIRTSAKIIEEKFGGRWGFNVLIDSNEYNGVKNAHYLQTVSDFRKWVECDSNNDLCVGRTDAFPDFIKTMHMAMNNDDPAFFKVPQSDAVIMDYFEIYSDTDADSDGRVDRFESYIDPEFRTCNIMTRLGQNGDGLLGTAGLKHIQERISKYLTATLPAEYDFKITGYPLMLIKSVDYIVNGQVQSLLLTLLVIFVVVLILLKDFCAALLSLIPMSVAVIFNFGIMGWFGIHLDVATSIIAAIAIGIGVDDTIHFLNTFRYYRKQGADVDTAIEKTLQVAGKAIIFTSLALIFGFSVLELSTFKPLMLFGLLMAVTMVATTVGALLVLPSAIKFTKIRLVKADAVPAKKSIARMIPLLAKKN